MVCRLNSEKAVPCATLSQALPVSLVLLSRNIESGLYDDQPNTPSKSKMMPRRPMVVYLSTLAILLLVGMLFVRPDVGSAGEPRAFSGTENDRHRPRVIENSEARQREALEIADRLQGATRHLDPLMGQTSSGGSVIGEAGDQTKNTKGARSEFMDAIVSNEPVSVEGLGQAPPRLVVRGSQGRPLRYAGPRGRGRTA